MSRSERVFAGLALMAAVIVAVIAGICSRSGHTGLALWFNLSAAFTVIVIAIRLINDRTPPPPRT